MKIQTQQTFSPIGQTRAQRTEGFQPSSSRDQITLNSQDREGWDYGQALVTVIYGGLGAGVGAGIGAVAGATLANHLHPGLAAAVGLVGGGFAGGAVGVWYANR